MFHAALPAPAFRLAPILPLANVVVGLGSSIGSLFRYIYIYSPSPMHPPFFERIQEGNVYWQGLSEGSQQPAEYYLHLRHLDRGHDVLFWYIQFAFRVVVLWLSLRSVPFFVGKASERGSHTGIRSFLEAPVAKQKTPLFQWVVVDQFCSKIIIHAIFAKPITASNTLQKLLGSAILPVSLFIYTIGRRRFRMPNPALAMVGCHFLTCLLNTPCQVVFFCQFSFRDSILEQRSAFFNRIQKWRVWRKV